MLQYERQQAILDFLKQHHTATIHALAKHLYTSEASVRRDIAALESAGLALRVYGGVVLPEHKNEVVPVELRESANSAAKEIIAAEAAKFIHDGDTVFFDSSSTVRRICKHIKNRKHLKIITNNVRICQELKDTDITVYCTGGEYYKKLDCFLGAYAEKFITAINATSVFFSCKGLSDKGTLTDVSELEIAIRQAMLSHADSRYLLCDGSKVGQKYAFTLCHASELTQIICDKDLPEFPQTKTASP
jgi:DeoR/GlpR family transcriptional regulator of sugar metabolism